jgi:hypothetical protein
MALFLSKIIVDALDIVEKEVLGQKYFTFSLYILSLISIVIPS